MHTPTTLQATFADKEAEGIPSSKKESTCPY